MLRASCILVGCFGLAAVAWGSVLMTSTDNSELDAATKATIEAGGEDRSDWAAVLRAGRYI